MANKRIDNKTDENKDFREFKSFERKMSIIAYVTYASYVIMTICMVIAFWSQNTLWVWLGLAMPVASFIFEELFLRFKK